jgi:hypothetical protein
VYTVYAYRVGNCMPCQRHGPVKLVGSSTSASKCHLRRQNNCPTTSGAVVNDHARLERGISGYRSTIQGDREASQTKSNPPRAENQRPNHRVRLTPAHLVQYIRINTTHRIALLHVGTELYRPSRRTPHFLITR